MLSHVAAQATMKIFKTTIALISEDIKVMPSNVKIISSLELFIKQLCNPTDKITYYVLVWKILRSQIGLSSTFQRLLFGLCVADILWSFSFMLSTLMIPKEVD